MSKETFYVPDVFWLISCCLFPGHKVNCTCPVHKTHVVQYKPHLQSYGITKKEPLVIDSDDEDITIIEGPLMFSKGINLFIVYLFIFSILFNNLSNIYFFT